MHLKKSDREQTRAEEIANAATHGVGLAFSVTALVVLVVRASMLGSAREIIACSIFGASLILLYTASTLYHAASKPRVKHAFKIADHCAIYLLIAGSYTPFVLINLRGAWGWSLFGIVWGLAVIGLVFKLFFVNRFKHVSTFAYLGMGWLAIIAIKPFVATIAPGGMALIVAGGLAYSFGVIFYLLDRKPWFHAIWHVFVLKGSALHFAAVLLYALPAAG